MARTLEIVERKLGERCCNLGTTSTLGHDRAQAIAADLDILAHPIRLQLLDVLSRNEGRVCVCDLEAAVPVKQPTVSHHLRLLREAGLVESEKVGQWVYYHVRRPALRALRARVATIIDALS